MNPGLHLLQSYPFEKLSRLLDGATPPASKSMVDLSIGEPAHGTPAFIRDALIEDLATTARYPATRGQLELRAAVADWLAHRFNLPAGAVDPARHVLPLNGTREGLFSIVQFVVDRSRPEPVVVMPNPCYQVYEGAALLAGATPYFLNLDHANGYLPDYACVPESIWERCQLLYLCSPHNPTGTIMQESMLREVQALAERHDFIVVADECYSELYFDEAAPPPGILSSALDSRPYPFARCLTMHSLSKRSNVPGLRSGFVAGDPEILAGFYQYRTYQGSAMPLYVQHASALAWADEDHVIANRALYRAKYQAVAPILNRVLPAEIPGGGFYFWLKLPIDDETFTRRLFEEEHVKVVPGSYLARDAHGANPGRNHIRIALVAGIEQCVEAAERIVALLSRLN
ncbi:MAG: succinyldiaminopimelate transaminase [Gammaproteobacteria bacterium]|nr:succinyldiaminopimelate transaminase [Gammaproteobacteria bacterium]